VDMTNQFFKFGGYQPPRKLGLAANLKESV